MMYIGALKGVCLHNRFEWLEFLSLFTDRVAYCLQVVRVSNLKSVASSLFKFKMFVPFTYCKLFSASYNAAL